jgi:hypothetical protein
MFKIKLIQPSLEEKENKMKKYLVGVVVALVVLVFIGNSADNALDQTRAINDKKEYCLKNEGSNKIDDECRVIIREARGE